MLLSFIIKKEIPHQVWSSSRLCMHCLALGFHTYYSSSFQCSFSRQKILWLRGSMCCNTGSQPQLSSLVAPICLSILPIRKCATVDTIVPQETPSIHLPMEHQVNGIINLINYNINTHEHCFQFWTHSTDESFSQDFCLL